MGLAILTLWKRWLMQSFSGLLDIPYRPELGITQADAQIRSEIQKRRSAR